MTTSKKSVEVFAPAKINLTLHVTGRRDDGYHLLDSLVVFARDVGDRLTISASDTLSLTLSGQFTDGVPVDETNLVLKAARLLQEARGVSQGAAIHLEKNLPNGAGIGGGSSDAAAALQALAEFWDVEALAPADAVSLGADLPVCLAAPAPQRMQGIGEILSPVPQLPEMHLVLLNSGDHIPTGKVFTWLRDAYGLDGLPMAAFPDRWDLEAFHVWLLGQHNELTKCASEFSDNIQVALSALRSAGALDADMSGSGSTCWGLFETAELAMRAANTLAADHPTWWVKQTAISR